MGGILTVHGAAAGTLLEVPLLLLWEACCLPCLIAQLVLHPIKQGSAVVS